jgi:hypothetical protein
MATKKKTELWVDGRFNSFDAYLGNGMKMVICWESKGYSVRIMDQNFPERFKEIQEAKKFAEMTAHNILQEGLSILTKFRTPR